MINLLLEDRHAKNSPSHCLSLKNITIKQWQKIKSSIVDTNNCLSKIFPLFYSLNYEFSPGFKLIGIFSSHFSFHQANYKNKESKEAYFCNLDKIFKNAIIDSYSVVIISDTSIKNNVATLLLHIYSNSNVSRRLFTILSI